MSELNKDRIVDKVRKLLNIAGNEAAAQGEIEAAMLQVQRLMEKHHISEEDLAKEPSVMYHDLENAPMNRVYCVVGKKMAMWEKTLGSFVAQLVGVECYLDLNKNNVVRKFGIVQLDDAGNVKIGQAMVFFGVAEDTAIAETIYNELRVLIYTMARSLYGNPYGGSGASYGEGFVSGLSSKRRKAIEDERNAAKARLEHTSDSTGLILIERRQDLVVRKQELAKRWLEKEKGIKLRQRKTGCTGARDFDHTASSRGYADGRATDVEATRRKKLG